MSAHKGEVHVQCIKIYINTGNRMTSTSFILDAAHRDFTVAFPASERTRTHLQATDPSEEADVFAALDESYTVLT